MIVLGAEENALFGRKAIEAVARAYCPTAAIMPGMGHDMMLNVGWEGVTDRIVRRVRDEIPCVQATEVAPRP